MNLPAASAPHPEKQTSYPTVEVLLATYNGELFLEQQVDSILEQTYPNLSVLASDDGSSDRTRDILDSYVQRYPERFRLMPAEPPLGGAKWNFLRLIQQSTAPYVCLADQDDVWLPDKVARSMEAMRSMEQRFAPAIPLLVFTDLRVVDRDLHPNHGSFWAHQNVDPDGIHSFRRMLTQNVVTGCTALMNAPLRRLACSMPSEAFMHDWWIALLAAGFGAGQPLRECTVLYRQHGSNVLGAIEHARPNLVPKLRYHTRRRRQWEITEQQAEGMLRVYGSQLSEDKRRLLEAYVRCETSGNRLVRVWTLLRNRFFQKGLRPNLAILWYLWDMKAAKRDTGQAANDICGFRL